MFKLVQIDDDTHQQVPLSGGKQVIGRGNLLDCDDKRISRNHAELDIVGDKVLIKALHTNPCFFINSIMGDVKIIRQNSVVTATHGDKLGLTPDKHWYDILNTESNGINFTAANDFQRIKYIIDNHKDISWDVNVGTSEDRSADDALESKCTDAQKSIKKDLKESDRQTSGSPPILPEDGEEELLRTCRPDEPISQSPGKRCLFKQEPTSPIDIKKVKTDVASSADDARQTSGSLASTSGASSTSSDASPSIQKKDKRERCMYGEKCYRKNPQHKSQYSHPSDADWGVGPQAPCPWGYACARRDPRHWRDHTHPYGMHPPPPAGIKKKKTHIVQRNGKIFYINAHAVNFYDDHFEAEDSDGDSVDYDYEFD